MPGTKEPESKGYEARFFCGSCGAELLGWLDLVDTGENDDAAYQGWLDTACSECDRTPRQNGAK